MQSKGNYPILLACSLLAACAASPQRLIIDDVAVEPGCPGDGLLGAKVRCREQVTDLAVLEQDLRLVLKDHPDQRVLVIFDIDDTLLTSTQFLGSDRWYRWQSGEQMQMDKGEPVIITAADEVACKFAKIDVFYEFARFEATQPEAPALVKHLQSRHAVMALTSRSPGARGGTERELERAGYDFAASHLMPPERSLNFRKDARGVSYANGIVMSTGLDKGEVLAEILALTGHQQAFDLILFVDDGAANLADMNAAWKSRAVGLFLYHYTRIDKRVSAAELEGARRASRRLDDFLASAYPDRLADFRAQDCE